MKNAFTDIVKRIIGWCVLVLTAAGGFAVIAYVIALIVGGEIGAAIVAFLYERFYVWLTWAACIVSVIGIIRVYLTGEHGFKLSSRKKKKDGDNKEISDDGKSNDSADGGEA